jgi:phosphonate transport system substrate-binding protein
VLVAGAAGYYFYVRSQNPQPPPVDELAGLKEYLVRLAANQKLDARYTDTDPKDLVADTPKEPSKLLTVNEILFTAVGTENPAEAEKEWTPLMAALAGATGKKVKYLDEVKTIEDQVAAVRDGKLHVTAFNTGAVPTAVNTAGFVPLFAPADKDGKFGYQMLILVRAGAPEKAPGDLKGKKIGLVALSSNSGAKAPMVALKEKFGLLPGRDYQFGFTGQHERSVQELIEGKYDAVCVASDLLRSAEAAGKLDKSKYTVIYTSDPYPQLCFGIPHDLPPALQAQVKAAFAAYKFDPQTPLGKRYTAQGKIGFVPISYERDWESVRKIDDVLSHLLDGK